MYLNIKIKEDFRTLKKDTEYKFDFTNQDRYLIVGPNGCLHLLISYVAFSAIMLATAVRINLDMQGLVI